jgi:hypothetical protein
MERPQLRRSHKKVKRERTRELGEVIMQVVTNEGACKRFGDLVREKIAPNFVFDSFYNHTMVKRSILWKKLVATLLRTMVVASSSFSTLSERIVTLYAKRAISLRKCLSEGASFISKMLRI